VVDWRRKTIATQGIAQSIRKAALALVFVGGGCVSNNIDLGSESSVAAAPDYQGQRPWTFTEGAPVRGDTSKKRIALIFTGGDYGEGTGHILDVLHRHKVKGSFFVTGDYIRKPDLQPHLTRMVKDGHYLGPHSDHHPLYAPWDDRKKTLVTEQDFRTDLLKNIDDLRAYGAMKDKRQPVYFIPPYEWYNEDQVRWSRPLGVLLFNFTPGSGSNRDWAPEDHKSFAPSKKILDDILAYEQKDPHGLNGFLLLLHLGSQRRDKMHALLEPLLEQLAARGYRFVRVNEMLK
jgi:peptidoglycan/xylan/chitin deacetylase (PgdA/CDA1 family)